MTIEYLHNAMIDAMKNGRKTEKNVLTNAIAAIKKAAIDKGCRDNIPEDLVESVLLKEKKIVDEQINTCPATREDLRQEYMEKATILGCYLPAVAKDEDEIKQIIESYCEENGIACDKNARATIMKYLKTYRGQIPQGGEVIVDMKAASQVLSNMMK